MALAIFYDVNEENHVRTADKGTAATPFWDRGDVIGMLSHDLRTPLNGIMGFLEALAATELDSDQKETLEIVQQCAVDLNCMLDGILSCAQVNGGHAVISKGPVDLARLLRNSIRQFRLAAGCITLELELPQALPEVLSLDQIKIQQIVNNLLSNAIKFTERGQIVLRAELVTALTNDGTGVIQLTVADTGMGISSDQLDRVFAPFQRGDGQDGSSRRGVGLGLAIVEKLTIALGGSISMKSKLGVGTTVMVRIPCGVPIA